MKILLETIPSLKRELFSRVRLGLTGLASEKEPFLELGWGEPGRDQAGRAKFAGRAKLVGRAGRTDEAKGLFKKILSYFLLFISIFSVLVVGFILAPEFYYRFFPADTEPVESLEAGSTWGGEFEREVPSLEPAVLPPKNESLPTGTWLIIPRIGVRTQPRATQDPKQALQDGVWLAPDYGRPGDQSQVPLIMAAHRYGWKWWWQDEYWRYHSFYKLPELKPGDLIEVIADQRKWTYEVYAGEEGEELRDYEADLILYTCKFLNSPLRHFRYARLLELSFEGF